MISPAATSSAAELSAVPAPFEAISDDPARAAASRDAFLWVLVALAFAFRLIYNLALHPDGHPPSSFVIDEPEYFGAAHMLLEGRGFSFFDTALWVRPPLYVLMIAGIEAIGGVTYLPVLVAQSLLSALTLQPLYMLAHALGGRMAGRLAALLALLYLPFTLFAGLLLSETLFLFLFAWALVALSRAHTALQRQGSRWWPATVAAGVLLGASVLTRSTALGFVPLAALWLVLPRSGIRARFGAAALLVGVSVAMLTPWVARNYAAYGRFVAVDTTSGYNLWLAAVGVRDEPRLQADLLALPDPVARQDFAYARAFDVIAADPLAFAGKGLKESLDLWRPLFSAEERQVRGYTLGRVPAWHLAALTVLDDLLYVAILLLALGGLALVAPHPLKWLVGLWVLLWVAMAFVFFAVTRFRLPIVAGLLPVAGSGLAMLVGRSMTKRVRVTAWRSILGAAAGVVAVLVAVVPSVPLEAPALGIQRWTEQSPFRDGERLLREGHAAGAIAAYLRANTSLFDTRYGLAVAYLQAGERQRALDTLLPSEPEDRFEPLLIRAEAARESGDLDSARSLFNARVVQVAGEEALDWAWDHLRPPAVESVEIGSGLDVGYVRGFHKPERDAAGRTFRWSTAGAEVRGVVPFKTLVIDWNGWRPAGAHDPAPVLRLGQWPDNNSGVDVRPPLARSDEWVSAEVPVNSPMNAVSIASSSFVGSGADPRLLGVRVASVRGSK